MQGHPYRPGAAVSPYEFDDHVAAAAAAAASSLDYAAAADSSAFMLADDIPVPPSPPYFIDFNPRLDFLGNTIVEQREKFYERWTKFQLQRDLPIHGHDDKRLGTITIDAFEAFRAVVTRGGFFRVFGLHPVQAEVPPLLDDRGCTMYAILPAEMPYEVGSPDRYDLAAQVPMDAQWANSVYLLADGRFLRNVQVHRTFCLYYERFILPFESAHCWTAGAPVPTLYSMSQRKTGMCRIDLGETVNRLQFVELPSKYQSTSEEMDRWAEIYAQQVYEIPDQTPVKPMVLPKLDLAAFSIGATTPSSTTPAAAAAAAVAQPAPQAELVKPLHAKITSLHLSGTYALQRTLQACALSNPLRMNGSLLRELVGAMNHLLAMSKQYAIRASTQGKRKAADAQLETLILAAEQAGVNIANAATSFASLVVSYAQPSWYFDVLLLFEYDLISHLLDQLLHPRALQNRAEHLQKNDRSAPDDTKSYAPVIPGLPSSFGAAPSYGLLPPAAHRYFLSQLLHHLSNSSSSYPNLTPAILTVLASLSYPGSVLQTMVGGGGGGKKHDEEEEEEEPLESVPERLVPTIRANLLQHRQLLSVLLDLIDSSPSSTAMHLQLPTEVAEDSLLDEDRFQVLDLPDKNVGRELDDYLKEHSNPASSSQTKTSDGDEEMKEDRARVVAFDSVSATALAEPATTVNIEADGNIVMASSPDDRKYIQPSNSGSSAPLSDLSISSGSQSATVSPLSSSSFFPVLPRTSKLAVEARYLALQIVGNLANNVRWGEEKTRELMAPFGSSATPADRRPLFWRELTLEFNSYYVHLAQQTSRHLRQTGGIPELKVTMPPIEQMECIMASIQLLLSMLPQPSSRAVLVQLLPNNTTHTEEGDQKLDFYAIVLGIALLDLQATKSAKSDTGAPIDAASKPSYLHWSTRIQLACCELLIQFFMLSANATAFLLEVPGCVARMVRCLVEAQHPRVKRTVAAIISALLVHLHEWEHKQTQTPDTIVSASKPSSLLFCLFHPHQSSMFQACAGDPDVALLLSKWLAHLNSVAKKEQQRTPPAVFQVYITRDHVAHHPRLLGALASGLPGWFDQRLVSKLLGYPLDLVDKIDKFKPGAKWRTEFSNVHQTFAYTEKPITVDGLEYSCTEAYFQSMKVAALMDAKTKELLCKATPEQAYNMANRQQFPMSAEELRDWESRRDDIMRTALRQKFSDASLQLMLLETGSSPLVQLKPNDPYWGTGRDGRGRNRLGELLEELRGELSKQLA